MDKVNLNMELREVVFYVVKTPSNVHQFGIMVTYVVVCYCADKSPRFWEYVVVIWPVIDLQRMFFIFGV
jgi:hypothetical protein